ncbi:MAG: hypothetical protein JWM53_3562 [bacterium]|nr:hypothetical protein [bacterium]
MIATRALASSGDYRLDSREWNGLGRLHDEAVAAGCALSATETLDWSALDARDVVWFVYPRTAVDGGMLRRYLEAGGRAVLADDFGASDAALAALSIRRLRGELRGVDRYDGNAALPIARQTMSTELSVGISNVVANHPAFFSTPNPATYSFSPGAALVVEGRLGKGYFVAIADPSVLINNMLDVDDNLAFARALVKRTCKPGERIHLVTQSFVARGEPSGELSSSGPSDSPFVSFNRMLETIDEVVHAAIYGRMAGLVEVLLAVAALLLFWRAWPPPGRIDGHWTRAASVESGWRAWQTATSAAYLRDEVAVRLSESLGASMIDWTPAELRARVARAHGPRAAELAAGLWARLKRAPSWIGRRQLARLHRTATALFDALAERGQG